MISRSGTLSSEKRRGPSWRQRRISVAPAGSPGNGSYAFAPADAGARIPHADFARAVLDEVLAPTLHGTHAGVTGA